MTTLYNLAIGSSYNFTLRAQQILTAGYRGATVKALLDYDSAKLLQDVDAEHASVLPDLPSGTPRKAKDLVFVKIETTTGEQRVLAMDWIAAQPEAVTASVVTLVVHNCPPSRLATLSAVLRSNGFDQFVYQS